MKYQFHSTQELSDFLKDQLLSASETAEILEVSTNRVGHMVRDGKLDTVKEQPKMFLKEVVLEKKKELEQLRKKYRPYDE
ncbi:hypothetical protein [Halalkalibacterium halodurans]|uniref:DNA-binding protein n=1 Tax=Halalkalibacterium halodurans TaxID=86665 RepID=A0A0M0KG92_ALKHA|nr:hypothetical protein [Halalkalibacterium halodurans]TPE68594.1 DNA-binding protein [Halalkalibacterium halodurans]